MQGENSDAAGAPSLSRRFLAGLGGDFDFLSELPKNFLEIEIERSPGGVKH
jgi:hypothetical protein